MNTGEGVQNLNTGQPIIITPDADAEPGEWSPFDADGTPAPAREAGFIECGALREDAQ